MKWKNTSFAKGGDAAIRCEGLVVCLPRQFSNVVLPSAFQVYYEERPGILKSRLSLNFKNIPHPMAVSYVKCGEATGKNTIMCLVPFSESEITMKHVVI